MLQFFKIVCSSRFCWFLLFAIATALEGFGLYFQYGLNYAPCVNCVYERAYFLGYILTGFIGAMAANYFIVRFLCSAGFLASSIGGILIAIDHYNAYTNPTSYGSKCKLMASYPDFLPLDEIAPWMFKSFALCTDRIDWAFFGQSMPFWIMIAFAVGTIASFMMFISNFVKRKGTSFGKLYN
ncbi:MAG: disulfide bond formation protein B [Succinivibrio sp.]